MIERNSATGHDMNHKRKKPTFSVAEPLECRRLLTTFELSPGDSIQATVDLASDNDTIVLNEGTYDQSIDIQNKSINLIGVGDVTLSGETLDPSTIGLKAKDGGRITLTNIDFTEFALPVDIENVGTTTITDVNAFDNGLGVYVTGGNKATVTGLNSSNNGPAGFVLADLKTATARDITTNGNDLSGIQVINVNRAKFFDVVSNGNDDEGLEARDVGSLFVTNGEFNGNGVERPQSGIDIQRLAKTAKLKNVVSSNNTDSGLSVTQSSLSGKVIALDSVFNSNDENGLDFDFVKTVVVNRTTVNDNLDDGLDVDTGRRVTVKNSEFARNGDDGIDVDNALFKQRKVNAFDNGDQDIEL